MRVYFCRSRTIPSWVVRALTWSDFSHTALGTERGTVIEAVWPKVREIPLPQFLADNGTVEVLEVPCRCPSAAILWARQQVGLGYDLTALFGWLLHRDWSDPCRWFCSEFVAEAFEEGGSPLFRENAVHRITPQDLWMLPFPEAS